MSEVERRTEIQGSGLPRTAAIFGASGGIGSALVQRIAALGCDRIYAGSRSGDGANLNGLISFSFDITDESSIAGAADIMRTDPPQWVIVASGVLTLDDGAGPERKLKRLNPEVMAEVLAINTIGPALIGKHMLPLMRRDERSVFAALSARVGSISDNGLGGWHSYRASKAALNMILKNFAIEMARTHPNGVVLGLHPGTVDTDLSTPFQKGLAQGQLTDPLQAADNLISVLTQVGPMDSGHVIDFKGKRVSP